MRIRLATPADERAFLTFDRRVRRVARFLFSESGSAGEFRRLVQSPVRRLLVLETEGRIAGCAIIFFPRVAESRHVARVQYLAVAPEWQGMGYGSALLARAIEHLKRRRRTLITLEVVAGNRPALRLYRAFGFEHAGRFRGAFKKGRRKYDVLLLALSL